MQNIENNYYPNHFLVSLPSLADPNFDHTIVYLLEHNKDGAMGITINREGDYPLADIAEQAGITPDERFSGYALDGGPVQTEMVFVLHPLDSSSHWEHSICNQTLAVTCSKDILEAIAAGSGPGKWRLALGYAGWGAGQLEQELIHNAWLATPADERFIFDTKPEDCWKALGAALGFDLELIATDSGHA